MRKSRSFWLLALGSWLLTLSSCAQTRDSVKADSVSHATMAKGQWWCLLCHCGDLRGLWLQPRHRRKAAFGAGADRPDRAQEAGPGQAGPHLCPAFLHPNRKSRLRKTGLLDFRFSEVWKIKNFTSRSQILIISFTS